MCSAFLKTKRRKVAHIITGRVHCALDPLHVVRRGGMRGGTTLYLRSDVVRTTCTTLLHKYNVAVVVQRFIYDPENIAIWYTVLADRTEG